MIITSKIVDKKYFFKENSSRGRMLVSKTKGIGFKSHFSCLIYLMVYVLGKQLKDYKKCYKSLIGFFGIGNHSSQQICDLLGFGSGVKLNTLSPSRLSKIAALVQQNYMVNQVLQSDIKKSKLQQITISCYKGFRQVRGLPLRGQRTHSNSRTCRKQKKTKD